MNYLKKEHTGFKCLDKNPEVPNQFKMLIINSFSN